MTVSNPTVAGPNVVDICAEYGVSTTLADNSTQINNALAALGPAGLVAWISQPGLYNILNPIQIGNGTGSGGVASTRGGRLLGPGGFNSVNGTAGLFGGAVIRYNGVAGAPAVVEVLGPISGWEVGCLTLQGGGAGGGSPLATTGLLVNAGYFGNAHDLYSFGGSTCIHCQSSNNNSYRNLFLKWGSKAGGGPLPGGLWGGIWLETNGVADTFFEDFQNISLVSLGAATSGFTHAFLYFGDCDNVKMSRVRQVRIGTDTMYGAVFDYTVNAAVPTDCHIDDVDFDAGFGAGPPFFLNVGAPGATAAPNRITNIAGANGGGNIPADPGLANLIYNSPSAMAKGTAVLAAGTVAVANGKVTANSIIRVTNAKAGGTVGALSVVPGAGTFTVNSTSNVDTSTVFYEVISY